MKKNLFIAALAFVAMGANAQVVNTLDGYQAGDQFEKDGVKYELIAVDEGNPVKVVEAVNAEITVQDAFSMTDNYTVTDFSAGFAQLDLDKVNAPASEPLTVEEAYFTEDTYTYAELVVPEASIVKYAAAPVWRKFMKKYTDTGKLLGDVDGNNEITNNDVVQMLEIFLADDEDLYDPMFDMDGNGEITNNDVILIQDLFLADVF